MSDEFREWQAPLEQTETVDTGDDALHRAWEELERLLDQAEGAEREEAGEAQTFQEFPPVRLIDGLTLERLGRPEEVRETAERVDPQDYTSNSYTDIGGICRYGQVDVERLTPEALEHISGDPKADIPLWSLQSEPNSCAVDCASFVLRGEVDETITEAGLIREGRELGLYRDEGTYFSDVGALCEVHGMGRERLLNASLEDIEAIHDAGGKVLALVSGPRLAYPKAFGLFRADHVVQVVGVDRNDPEQARVILNDPGREDGQGLSVPENVFQRAWKTSQHSLVALYRERGLER